MSLDFPQYIKIKKRSRWLGLCWRIGDTAYYIGLLGMIFVPLVTVGSRQITFQRGLRGLFVFVLCALIFVFSIVLKRHVHNQARKTWPDIYSHEN